LFDDRVGHLAKYQRQHRKTRSVHGRTRDADAHKCHVGSAGVSELKHFIITSTGTIVTKNRIVCGCDRANV